MTPLLGTKASFPFFNEERLSLIVSHRIVTKQVFRLLSFVLAVVLFLLSLSELPPKIDHSDFVLASVWACVVEEVTAIVVAAEAETCTCEVDADTCVVVVCGCVVVAVVSVCTAEVSAVVTAVVFTVTASVVVSEAEEAVVSGSAFDEQPPNKSKAARKTGRILILFNFVSSEKKQTSFQWKRTQIY